MSELKDNLRRLERILKVFKYDFYSACITEYEVTLQRGNYEIVLT